MLFHTKSGHHIYYEVHGKGKAIVCFHGNGQSVSYFKPQLPLAAAFQLILIDTPGHGQSSPLKEKLTFAAIATEVKELLDSYYGKVTTMPDDAKWRLDILKENYVPYMKNESIYPKIFMKEKDLDKIAQIEADMNDYIARKRAEWITKGGIDKEWESYKKELERYGLTEWLTIKQKYYDDYVKTKDKE